MLRRLVWTFAILISLSPNVFGQITLNNLTDNPPGVSPGVTQVGTGSFALTIRGSGFTTNSQARLGSTNLATTFVDATSLTAVVPASLLKAVGTQPVTVADGNTTSNAIDFKVAFRGDVNANGNVNIGDPLVIARSLGGLVQPPVPAAIADINLNDFFNIGDALVLALFTGGGKDNFTTPIITATSATSSTAPGSDITITGTSFSSTASSNAVFFSNANGGVSSVTANAVAVNSTDKTITVTVPASAVSGPIFVKRKDYGIPGQPFVISLAGSQVPLYVSKIANVAGLIAGSSTITVTGTGFDPQAANDTVTFSAANGTTVSVTATTASATSLTVQVPSQAVSGFVFVTVGNQSSNRKSILISATPTPLWLNQVFYPDDAGEPILIEGTGFNIVTPADNQVLFTASGNTQAAGVVVAVGRTELIVLVPAGAVTGPIQVKTGGGTIVSNTVNYAAQGTPTLASISPSFGARGATVAVTLTGTNLAVGATAVTISGTGVTGSAITVSGTTSLTANFIIAADAASGARSVTVTTVAGTSNAQAFTVYAAPAVNTISPSFGVKGAFVDISFSGSGFAGATSIVISGTGVTATNLNVTSDTAMTATFTIAAGSASGARNVTVVGPGGTSNGVVFTIFGVPAISSIVPSLGYVGGSGSVTITGTEFITGVTTVTFGGTGVTATSVSVASTTSLTAAFAITANAAATARTVTVSTSAGTSNVLTFTVYGAPQVNTVSPSYGFRGTTFSTTLTGTNFVPGATSIVVSGTGVTGGSVNVTSSTSLTASFTITADTSFGDRTVQVMTGIGASNTVTFTLLATPTLSSVFPAAMRPSSSTGITLTGTGFAPGIAINIPGVTVQNIQVSNQTSLSATFVSSGVGGRGITVTTAAGTSNSLNFTVADSPFVNLGGPTSGLPGESFTISLNGTSFVPGASQLLFSGSGVSAGPADVTDNGDGTQTLRALISIDADATPGDRQMTVQTPIGTSNAIVFTVLAPVPTQRTLSPIFGLIGASVPVTITGTGFVPGQTTIQFSDAGITAPVVNVTSSRSLTTTFVIDSSASASTQYVWVSTPGGQTATGLPFSVISSPTLATITPSAWYQGGSLVVSLSGGQFAGGATTISAGTGVTASQINVANTSAMTATLTIDAAAPTGAHSVKVTTPAGTSGAINFTVNARPAAPTLTSINVSSGMQGAQMTVVLTGTNLIVGGTALSFSATGVLVTSISGTSTTAVTATLVLSSPPGALTIAAVTPGGTSNTLPFTISTSTIAAAAHISTTHLAGSTGGAGYADNTGASARFNNPTQMWSDGTNVYIADTKNHTIRKMVVSTGAVTTLAGQPGVAGSVDGTGSSARFSSPYGIWGDGTSTSLYVSDTFNHTIRKIVIATGQVTTIAGSPGMAGSQDGTGSAARFNYPWGLWGDATNLYVADYSNNAMRKIVISTAAVTTPAGSNFSRPTSIWGNSTNLYVASSYYISKVVIATNAASQLSTSGSMFPSAIWSDGINIYIADASYNNVQKVPIAGGAVTGLAGSGSIGFADGTGTAAAFYLPQGIVGVGTNLYVADTGNSTIRKVTSGGVTTTVAGAVAVSGTSTDGTAGSAARFNNPQAAWTDGTYVYVADNYNYSIRKITISTGAVSTYAGSASSAGFADGTGTAAHFPNPKAIWGDGSTLYVTDDNVIRKIVVSTAVVTTPFGGFAAGSLDGTGTDSYFSGPAGLWGDGKNLFVADTRNHTIRKIILASGAVTTFAGTPETAGWPDGTGTAAYFNNPTGIWGDGTNLYVADKGNHTIRKIVIATGVVTTIAGSVGAPGSTDGVGTAARLNAPTGIWGDGSNLYISNSNSIRKMVLATGAVTTIAGNIQGSEDGLDNVSGFDTPGGIWGTGSNILAVDSKNQSIRLLTPSP